MARAASPLTDTEFFELFYSGGLPDWDYHPHDPDGPDPFEWKPSDWGRIDGRLVAVDYATPAMADPEENFRRWLERGNVEAPVSELFRSSVPSAQP